ncbi:MAG: ribonuclease P protein component [Marinilabiliaceae bacterium]|nr:ribonuclease P protein component [Marinilabiliaceae bacterium]
MLYTFTKEERLCNFHLIDNLFEEGNSFVKYPFRVVYSFIESEQVFPAQVLVSVSKKRFKRANKRNFIRRKIKEAYRLNKHKLYHILDKNEIKLVFAIIYLPTEILSYAEIEAGIEKVINQFYKLTVLKSNG